MAKNQIIDLSTTAANNTDVGGINIDEGMFPSGVNNAARYMAKMLADAVSRQVAKAAGTYTAAKTDHNQFWRCTGAVTINLTAAATLSDGWCLWVRANGGDVTIDPNGAEALDGQTQALLLTDGKMVGIICNGSAFFTVSMGFVSTSNDPGANGPTLELFHDSASPAVNDLPATFDITGRSSTGVKRILARIIASYDDPTNSSEDASLFLRNIVNGVLTTQVTLTSVGAAIANLLDLSGAGASQIKFKNGVNNSADAYTLDGYTDWVAYTPTFTGFGTAATVQIWSKRVGDTLHIRGNFTAGTTTAVEARMTIGFNGTSANVQADATKVPAIQKAGTAVLNANQAAQVTALIESSVTYITFGLQGGASPGLTKQLGTFVAAGNIISLQAEIPISGW